MSAIFSGDEPAEERVRNVVNATRLVLDRRGWLDASDLGGLDEQGISRAQLYEIIGYVGAKTISNYINHIAHTEVDAQFSEATKLPAYAGPKVEQS